MTGLESLAVSRCPHPDHVDVIALPLAADLPTDPDWWARRIFDVRAVPRWVRLLLVVRQALAPLIGVRRAPADVFRVRESTADEALIHFPDRHLDFWCTVGCTGGLLRVTTVVTLHGWRGRLYWAVVRFFHQPVTTAMIRRALHRARN